MSICLSIYLSILSYPIHPSIYHIVWSLPLNIEEPTSNPAEMYQIYSCWSTSQGVFNIRGLALNPFPINSRNDGFPTGKINNHPKQTQVGKGKWHKFHIDMLQLPWFINKSRLAMSSLALNNSTCSTYSNRRQKSTMPEIIFYLFDSFWGCYQDINHPSNQP